MSAGPCLFAGKPYSTYMSQCEKLRKLIDHMEQLVGKLSNLKELAVHQRIDQFYYMQKIEELKMLLHQFDTLHRNIESLTSRMNGTYMICASQWRKDVRWLNAYRPPDGLTTIL